MAFRSWKGYEENYQEVKRLKESFPRCIFRSSGIKSRAALLFTRIRSRPLPTQPTENPASRVGSV